MKQEAKIIIGIVTVSVALVVGAAFLLGNSTQSAIEKADPKLLIRSASHIAGNPKAKVEIVEFGDYQCPACGAAYPVTKKIIDEYKDKIKFVFRNFPLTQHQNAQIGAEAAEAAGFQGKFWEMHDLLYEKQSEWSESNNPMDYLVSYAKELKLDLNKFTKDVKDNKFADIITGDQNDGVAAGVNVTPTFFINTQKYPGVLDYSRFRQIIDDVSKVN